jgi:hypothetical protein
MRLGFGFSLGAILAQSPDGLLLMPSDTATEDGLLKDVYEKRIAEGVSNKFALKDAFKLKDSPWAGGRGLKWEIHTERNNSPMAVAQDGAFPEGDNQGYLEGFITQKKLMARWRTTDEQLTDTESSEGAYRSSRTENMERMIDDISYREEFYMGTDGRGIFGLINEATPSADDTLELDSPGGIAGANFGNRFIKAKMYLAAVNPATGTLRAGITRVQACNDDGTDVTCSMAANTTWADNDYIVQAANPDVVETTDTAYEHAPWGLPALIDDGTYRANYFGVDRARQSSHKSYVIPAVGALSFDLLQRGSDVVSQKLDGEISDIWCHHSIRRLMILLTQADRRYTGANLLRPDGGTVAFQQKDLTMGEVPIKALKTLPLAQMYLIDKTGADFVRYTSEAGKWVAGKGGEILVRAGTGRTARHAWEAWYFKRYQLFARNPGKCARLDGITGQTLVVVRNE